MFKILHGHIELEDGTNDSLTIATAETKTVYIKPNTVAYFSPPYSSGVTVSNAEVGYATRTESQLPITIKATGAGDITITADCIPKNFTFTYTDPVNGISTWKTPTTKPSTINYVLDSDNAYSVQLSGTPSYGYTYPNTVSVTNASYSYSNGLLKVWQATGNTTVAPGACVAKTYTVTVNSENATSIIKPDYLTYDSSENIIKIQTVDPYVAPEESQITIEPEPEEWSYSKNTTVGIITLNKPTGNTTITANCYLKTVAVNGTFNGCTSSVPKQMAFGGDLTLTITSISGYRLPTEDEVSSKLDLTNISYSGYKLESSTVATLELTNATGDVSITFNCIEGYNISWTTTGVTLSPNITWLDAGTSATINITANSGYIVPSVVQKTGSIIAKYTYSEDRLSATLKLSNIESDSTIYLYSDATWNLIIAVPESNLPVILSTYRTVTIKPGNTETIRIVKGTEITFTGKFATSSHSGSYVFNGTTYEISKSASFDLTISANSTITVCWNVLSGTLEDRRSIGITSSSSRNQFIDSGVIPSISLPFKVKFQTAYTGDPGYGNIFGSRHRSQEDEFQVTMYNNGTISMGNGSGNCRTSNLVATSELTSVHTFEYNGDTSNPIYIVDDVESTATKHRSVFDSQGSIYLYGVRQSGNSAPQLECATIYECIFGDIYGSDLTNCRWFVPTTIGTINCLWDIIHNKGYYLTTVQKTITITNSTDSTQSIVLTITYNNGNSAEYTITPTENFNVRYDENISSITISRLTSEYQLKTIAGTGDFSASSTTYSTKTTTITQNSTATILTVG